MCQTTLGMSQLEALDYNPRIDMYNPQKQCDKWHPSPIFMNLDMPNCLGRWVRNNIPCTLFHLQTFNIFCTFCTIQNMSHHLFLPGVSGCSQKKKHFKCLCREIGYKGFGGLRNPRVDRDQRQQEATVSTIAGNRGRKRGSVSVHPKEAGTQ